jgi:hypothetical protein
MIDAAKAAPAGTTLDSLLASVATRNAVPAPKSSERFRIAMLLVGKVAEQEFAARYTTAMQGQEFSFEDESGAGTETDVLVLNGKKRRAFRINIKAHGTFLREAKKMVGLEPEDTFALATYKIRDANKKSREEGLPFLFAIVSSAELATGPLADKLPADVVALADRLTLYKDLKGLRRLEDLLVDYLIDPSGSYGTTPMVADLRAAIKNGTWRIVSAVRADYLFQTKMWERVPSVAKRVNMSGNQSQPNMHFSLSQDMIALDDLLTLLRDNGIQHVATKIAYHDI